MQAQMQTETQLQPQMQEIDTNPHWSLATRIGFRFAFAYLVLFMFPFPMYYIPYTGKLVQLYTNLWHAIVPWTGKHILHLSYDITVFTNGSGDTTYDYLQALCLLTLAAAATIIWSA